LRAAIRKRDSARANESHQCQSVKRAKIVHLLSQSPRRRPIVFRSGTGKARGEWEELKIPCVTTQQLIEEHGGPYFIKVDIEGADFQTLHSLTAATAFSYVSLELNCVDPLVERLIELGYNSFKFVDGKTYWPTPEIFDHQLGWRLLGRVGRVAPFIRSGTSRLPLRLRPNSEYDPPGKYSPTGYEFRRYSSGLLGEQAAGSWSTGESALRWFSGLKDNFRRAGKEDVFWWDVHARHPPDEP
jgi:hypothetical protein